MEKQKIFWVVLSVSVFVVIVLVAGVYLLRQKPQAASNPPGAISPLSGPGPQVYEYSQEKQPAGAEQKPGETQTMHFYIGEGGEKQPAGAQPQSGTQPQAGAQPRAGAAPAAGQQAAGQQAAGQPQAQRPAAEGPGAQPAAAAALSRKASAAVRAKSTQPRRVIEYWIQAGSYKSQSAADELVATLSEKGLSGKVFSSDTSGTTFYRVRIGPYASKGEVDKFLSIVKQIQGLESSFVSQVSGVRNLN